MRNVLRVFYMIMIPIMVLLSPIFFVAAWLYWFISKMWRTATGMADDAIAETKSAKLKEKK